MAFALIAKTWLRKPHDTGQTLSRLLCISFATVQFAAAKRAESVISNGHTCLQACLSANPFGGSTFVGSFSGGNTQCT